MGSFWRRRREESLKGEMGGFRGLIFCFSSGSKNHIITMQTGPLDFLLDLFDA